MYRKPSRRARSHGNRTRIEGLERRVLFAAGDLDTSFGGDGIVLTDPAGFTGRIAAIDVQADGKTVAVGSATPVDRFTTRAAVVRYNADGSLDRSFGGGDGVTTFDRFAGVSDFSRLTDVEILPNGDVVAAGTALEAIPGGGHRPYVIVARLNSFGVGIGTYGNGGLAAVGGGGGVAYLRPRVALDALPTGEVFVAGQTIISDSGKPAVVKVTAAGTLDTSFGAIEHRGMWTLDAADDSTTLSAGARDVQVLDDGDILVAGDVEVWRNAFVARLNPNGTDDASFGGGDGLARLDYAVDGWNTTRVTGNALAVQDDDKIVLAGSVGFVEDRGGFRVTRLNGDGSVDRPFGDNGTRAFSFSGVGGMPTEVKVLSGGRILAGGMSTRFSNPGFAVGRLEADGDMDYTFGERGRVFTPQRVGDLVYLDQHNPVDMDVRSDGKIVMAGNFPQPGERHDGDQTPVLARYLDDAGPDPEPPPPGGAWTVQGEDAQRPPDETTIRSSHAGYTGSGYLDFSAASGASATWIVQGVGGPGEYVVEFRYANGGLNSRAVGFEANPAQPAAQPITFAPTGSWSTWRLLSVPVTMLQGSDALSIFLSTTGQEGPNIDSVTVRRVDEPVPPQAQQLQAEQAAVVGADVKRSHTGYTGTGYVDYDAGSGESIEWTFNRAAAGAGTLTFRYANGGTSSRPLELRVNGSVVNSRLSFAPTGSWSTWREVSVTVDLAAGTNRVRLTSVGNSGPNVDVLTVR